MTLTIIKSVCGEQIVQAYMRVRHARLKELSKLLTKEDFVFEPSSATPLASEVLQDGTGFLTPKDTDEFDLAVDEYINGVWRYARVRHRID